MIFVPPCFLSSWAVVLLRFRTKNRHQATWLARENHRITVESERAIGARDADAKRAVGALTAELRKARTAAAAAAGGARTGLGNLETHNQATSFSGDVDHGR